MTETRAHEENVDNRVEDGNDEISQPQMMVNYIFYNKRMYSTFIII